MTGLMPAAMNGASAAERVPLRASARTWSSELLITVAAACSMICCSVSLIHVNNFLMDSTRFPYAVPLVWSHMVFCSGFSFFLYCIWPSLFPAMTDPLLKVEVDRAFVVQGCMPLAMLFSVSLVLTNLAYSQLSVAFLQMIKESNIVWVYLLSLALGFELLGRSQVQIVMLAICGMFLTVRGEMHFVMVGFVIQLTAILLECVRIVLQGMLLSDTGGSSNKKLDPLTYVLLITPICVCFLSVVLCFAVYLPDGVAGQGLALPSYAEVAYWWQWILGDAALAFCLNVSIATIIKRTSPMSYIMCQLIKDAVAVGIGVALVGEEVSGMQFVGFFLQMCSVTLWSLVKNFPDKFNSSTGVLAGLFSLLGGPQAPQDKPKDGKEAA